ncbi:MAG: hypothetical protein HC929_18825 [Leptolyngbyaceae cyanobacterium SM2_5_2]|nr:hypothetical protein [Leptolyngbyaceae cyanobacterium SM2_5_2]
MPYVADVEDRPRVVLEDIQGQGDITFIPVAVSDVAAQGRTRQPKAQQIDVDIQGTSIQGGSVNLTGSVQIPPTSPDASPTPNEPVGDRAINRPAAAYATLANVIDRNWAGLTQPLSFLARPAWASQPGAAPTLKANLNLRTQKAKANRHYAPGGILFGGATAGAVSLRAR